MQQPIFLLSGMGAAPILNDTNGPLVFFSIRLVLPQLNVLNNPKRALYFWYLIFGLLDLWVSNTSRLAIEL